MAIEEAIIKLATFSEGGRDLAQQEEVAMNPVWKILGIAVSAAATAACAGRDESDSADEESGPCIDKKEIRDGLRSAGVELHPSKFVYWAPILEDGKVCSGEMQRVLSNLPDTLNVSYARLIRSTGCNGSLADLLA